MRLTVFIMLAIMLMTAPLAAADANPTAAIQAVVEPVLNVLKDPELAAEELKAERRKKIWALTSGMFAFDLLAKRAAGRYHWQNSFREDQRRQFTDLFGEFLGQTYLSRLDGEFSDLAISYKGQEILSKGRRAKVKTVVKMDAVETPMDYSMIIRDGQWKVYDIFVEGVSLAQNYQSQFRSLLENKPAAEVIERLKKKIEKQKKAARKAD